MNDVDMDRGITVRPDGTGSVVTLWGEVDASLRDAASLALRDVLQRGGAVVMDLGGVTLIDSSAVAFVLQLRGLCEETGQRFVLRDPGRAVLDVLRVVGTDGMVVETTRARAEPRPELDHTTA